MNTPKDQIPNTGGAVPVAVEVEVLDRPTLTEEEISEEEQNRQARVARLDAIGFSLNDKKETAIRYRLDFEEEWVEAHMQYDEGDVMGGSLRGTRELPADPKMDDYRKTRDNITRPAVLMVTSRVADMLFPTSDRNWDLTPSPDSELPESILAEEVRRYLEQIASQPQAQPAQQQIGPDGMPVQGPDPDPVPSTSDPSKMSYDERQSIEQRAAERRCLRMRTRIDDQLQESSYAAHGRDAIADGVMYGTGVIKGPFPKRRRARVFNEETKTWEATWVQKPVPAACYVDLFNFYPLPCRRISECPGTFELHLSTADMVRRLRHQPGFDPAQIARVLKDENRSVGSLASSILYRVGITSRSGTTASLLDSRYAVWEYHGPLPKQGIIDFVGGLLEQDKIGKNAAAAILGEIEDDPMIEMNCECWIVNGIVIKLAIEPVAAIEQIYHVYNYEERPDTLFGKGVPRVMRDDQLATTQLWQAMMLNAMMSAGLQIGVRKGGLVPMGPQGGQHDLTCTKPRVWAFTDEVDDIRKAFQAFEVPSVLDKLMPLYERSKKNCEEHIVLPSIVQGDPTQSVQTSSGLAMLMNAGNIVTRRLAKGWDDNITTPLIGGFFEYNMDHGPDDVKGDYTVIPRGSSHLLVKDVQSQRFLFALQTYTSIPELKMQMRWSEWGHQGLTIMDLDGNRLLYSEDEQKKREAEAAKNQQPSPEQMLAEARIAESQARSQAAQSTTQLKEMQLQQQQQESADSVEFRKSELATRMRIAELNYLAKLAELDEKALAQMREIESKMQNESMWARLQAGELAQKERRDAVEIAVESPSPRLA